MLIEIESLSHTFAAGTPLSRTALQGVSLSIAPGECVGIVGRTGSGKSTLVQHIAGLLDPTAGQVLLDGVSAHGRSAAARSRRRRIGIAFQYPEDQIFEQTVFREVAFGPRNLGVKDEEISARVSWAVTSVGLDPEVMLGRSPFTLSGGEMRRVALASVLALRPKVLILDEPTAGLDPRGRRELLNQVGAYQTGTDTTLILVSHDLQVLAGIVERVIVLQEGRIATDGPARRVLSSVETLRGSELEPPSSVKLLNLLRAASASVRTDKLLPEEAAAEIARTIMGSAAVDQHPGGRP